MNRTNSKDNENQKSNGILLNSEITIPDWFPIVYERRGGGAIAYLGAISKTNTDMNIECCPYWIRGKHSTDDVVKDAVLGFYRLENGIIFKDRFIDDYPLNPYEVIPDKAYIYLPNSTSTYYGIFEKDTDEINSAQTQRIFGLTYEDLDQVLEAYGYIFGHGNIYRRYPQITRSTQRNNCCDLSGAWIPKGFPYITFAESGYSFSHVSLSGFYQHLKLLLLARSKSGIWQKMLECGIDEKLLNQIIEINDWPYQSVRYGEY